VVSQWSVVSQLSVVRGQLSVVSQLSVVRGQLSVVSQLSVVRGQLSVVRLFGYELRTTDYGLRATNY
jgi:hypothetical protein